MTIHCILFQTGCIICCFIFVLQAGCTVVDEIVGKITSLGAHTILAICILAGGVLLTVFTTIIAYQIWCKKKNDGDDDDDDDNDSIDQTPKPTTSSKTPSVPNTPATKPPPVKTGVPQKVIVAPKPKKGAWSKNSKVKPKVDDDECDF